MAVRKATAVDVGRMVELASAKRKRYETYSPVFWKEAADAAAVQHGFFTSLLSRNDSLCLLHETPGGAPDGFLIARVQSAPPVYAPGGPVIVIDDFVVAHDSLWLTAGVMLLRATESWGVEVGAVASVTVCGHRDLAKRAALAGTGAHIASEWYVRAFEGGSWHGAANDQDR